MKNVTLNEFAALLERMAKCNDEMCERFNRAGYDTQEERVYAAHLRVVAEIATNEKMLENLLEIFTAT